MYGIDVLRIMIKKTMERLIMKITAHNFVDFFLLIFIMILSHTSMKNAYSFGKMQLVKLFTMKLLILHLLVFNDDYRINMYTCSINYFAKYLR